MPEIGTIPLLDIKGENSLLSREISAAVEGVLSGESFTLGAAVKAFEEEFAAYCGTMFAVGVGSGTDALHLALRALGIRPGDKVITTPNTYFATVEAIIMCGADPVFVDVHEDTFLIDPSKLERAITKRTRAVVPTHLHGQPADIEEICSIANTCNLKVVEDACQAHGASVQGKKVGTFGQAGAFSFYPGKNLGSAGDGGIILTDDQELAERLLKLRNHGQSRDYFHVETGFSSRLHEIQAAILRVKLKRLDCWNRARRYNARIYDEQFKGSPVEVPIAKDTVRHVYNRYAIKIKNRDRLKDYLASKHIESAVCYPLPLHLQPALSKYGFKRGDFPIAEKLAKRSLLLPISPEIKVEEIKFIASEVLGFVSERSKVA